MQVIAEYVGRSERTVSGYVSDIKGRRKEQQRAIIMRLDRFGWTQEEVAQVVGVTHQRITQILQEIAELPKLAKNVLASGIPHLEVAERFNLPLQVVWAIDLAGRTADGGLVASRQIFESTWQRHLAQRAIAGD